MTVASHEALSARRMMLVVMLARGHTTDRAAHELRLSRHTVGEEISALLERFDCKNRAELVAYCYVHRLLPIGVWPPPYACTAGQRTQPTRPGLPSPLLTSEHYPRGE